jgi:hypothetical protein
LKNFHAASHAAPVFPILVATQAEGADDAWQPAYPNRVRPPYRCGARNLRRALEDGLRQSIGPQLDGEAWGSAPYQPTPAIIEAARVLYARHSVEAISRHDAGAKAKTSDFMRRRKKIANFSRSEPEFLISYLDRHEAWAVVVCPVGGGQEIHTGEARIGEWFEAVRVAFPHWRVYVSPNLTDSEYAAQLAFERLDSVVSVVYG